MQANNAGAAEAFAPLHAAHAGQQHVLRPAVLI
jgi:hypothetical protein